MLPAAAYREMVVQEDAAEGCRVFIPREPEDALDHAECFTDYEAEHEAPTEPWHCDECGTRNDAPDPACLYCGEVNPCG